MLFLLIKLWYYLLAPYSVELRGAKSLYGDFFFLSKYLFVSVEVQLYSPERPLVDVAEVFLWLMAVGTILCASYWSAYTAREAAIEQDKLLKVILLPLFVQVEHIS